MKAQPIDIPFQKFVLSNGLTVIVHEDHKAPIVALNVWYHVGSKNEKPGKTGFAHLFEHLMFGGSEHIRQRYIEALERIGATDLNGTTNEDRTNYFENVPVSAFDFALFAESDRMGHFYNTISQEILDLQREVVINEKKQGDNQPYAVAEDLIVSATYPTHHPYSHTVIGSMEDLKAASLDDVKEWFKTYYGPSNAVLVVAGDVTVEQAREKVTKYFGDIPPGPPIAHQQSWIAKMHGGHREVAQDRVPFPRVYKVWNVPQFASPEATYLNLLSNVLTSGRSSRLHKRLVLDDQIAANVSSYVDAREIGGQFVIAATAKPDVDLYQVEAALDEELARLLQTGPDERELERMKTQQLANFVRGAERIGGFGGKSDILARSQTFTGSPDSYKQMLERLQTATVADVHKAATAWLSDGVYTLSVVPYPDLKPECVAIKRENAPVIGQSVAPKFPTLEHATLSNGLKLILAQRHEIPVVNFWLQVEGGYAADSLALPGTARLTTSLLTSGTARRSILDISDQTQLLGAQLSTGSSLNFATVYLSALKANLDESLDLFADVILNPTFPEPDFSRQRSLQLAAIENEKATPMQMALRVVPPFLYGDGHPYSQPLTGSGTAQSVSAITREQVVNFHRQWFRPGRSTLIIVGDTTLDEIKPKLELLFANWAPGDAQALEIKQVPGPTRPTIYLIDKPAAQQSVIMAGSLAPPATADLEPLLEAANNAFGGTFSARLNMNLREDKHWTYGASAFVYGARGQRPYLAVTAVQTDKTAETVEEILKEFRGIIGTRPITDDELARIKDQTILELAGSRETMNAIGGAIADLVEFNFPDNYWDTYPEQVAAITPAAINAVAKNLIRPDAFIWVIVGDRSQIEKPLTALSLGEIVYLDATESVSAMSLI